MSNLASRHNPFVVFAAMGIFALNVMRLGFGSPARAATETAAPHPEPTRSISPYAQDLLRYIEDARRSRLKLNSPTPAASPAPSASTSALGAAALRMLADRGYSVWVKRSNTAPTAFGHTDSDIMVFETYNGYVIKRASRIDTSNVPGCGKALTLPLSPTISRENAAKLLMEAPANTVFIEHEDGVRAASPGLHGRGFLIVNRKQHSAREVPCPDPPKGPAGQTLPSANP